LYKELGTQVDVPNGAIINLTIPEVEREKGTLANYHKKMMKAYSKPDMLKCIPIIWHEVAKMKGRVEEVLGTLPNKRVK